nr:hypothetical protein [Pandoravirus belohorizontensis]
MGEREDVDARHADEMLGWARDSGNKWSWPRPQRGGGTLWRRWRDLVPTNRKETLPFARVLCTPASLFGSFFHRQCMLAFLFAVSAWSLGACPCQRQQVSFFFFFIFSIKKRKKNRFSLVPADGGAGTGSVTQKGTGGWLPRALRRPARCRPADSLAFWTACRVGRDRAADAPRLGRCFAAREKNLPVLFFQRFFSPSRRPPSCVSPTPKKGKR